MKKIRAFGEIKNGGFYPKNSSFYLQQMKDSGNVSECVLTIEGANKRTIPQNNFAWMMFDKIAYAMREKGYEEVTSEMLYYEAQQKFCGVTLENKRTGSYREFTKPLKSLATDQFFDIMETIRVAFNENPAFDIVIQTPAEFFGLTENAYELLKTGVISFVEAKRQSNTQPK